MKNYKKILVLLIALGFGQVGFGQISVYYCEETQVYGWSVSSKNFNYQRDQNAENDCQNKGGTNPRQVLSTGGGDSSYGCYALVRGKSQNGKVVVGAAGGYATENEAIREAKSHAFFRSAVQSSLSVVTSGCLKPDAPKAESNNQSSQTSATPQWSSWKKINSGDCDLGIECSTKREVRYRLNYQLWFYYRVRNTSNKNISFSFNLTRKGKTEFTQSHVLSPGGESEFMHKMDGDYIDGVSVTNVINTVTKKNVCDESESNNQTNSNNQDLINELNDLCSQLQSILNNSSNTYNEVYNSICANGKTYQQNQINLLKSNIEKLKFEIKRLDKDVDRVNSEKQKIEEQKQKQEQAKQAEEERLQKEREAKKEQFDTAIQNGDEALNSNQYDTAMNHYSKAKSLAQNDSEKSLADSKYKQAFEAKRTAERKVRLEKQKEKDQFEDQAYVGVATSAIGLMAMVKDQYVHKSFSGKFQIGLGYEQMPLITNQNNSYAPYESYSDRTSYPTFHFGLRLEFLNNKMININSRIYYSLGFNAFETGVSGAYSETGIDGGIQFWYKKNTKFKLFVDVGSYSRAGSKTADLDAINNGTTTTDDVRDGEYDYSTFKYGFGPMFHHRHDGRETWIKAGLYSEKLSFAKEADPIQSFSLSANIESEIIVEFSYSKNYPVAGTINYPYAFTNGNQNYFSLKIIRQGKLW